VALHHDLLEQARHLAGRETKKPRQASLRRSISASYYALFHLLTAEAVARVAPRNPVGLRPQMRRAFAHGEMKSVCRSFAQGGVNNIPEATRHLISGTIDSEIQLLAGLFVQLQEDRHRADYDHFASFTRAEALQTVENAERAFQDWQAVRERPNATVFLAALMLQRQWARPN
jgi:uncharacterized protein (UPF0332 family)